jgi:hypothetical protein
VSQKLFAKYELAEARGQIPQGSAVGLTYANILELGVRSAAEGYYGSEALSSALTAAKAEQAALDLSDDILADVRAITKVYGKLEDFNAEYGGKVGATHTTGDFPKALANLRRTIIRQDTPIGTAAWRSWIPARLVGTTPNFQAIRGLNMSQMGELKKRAEGTDVQYTTMGFTSDFFFVANYERAFGYTWEMWLNDEINAFTRALRTMGEGALRTEAVVIFTAILDGVARTTGTGISTGGPTQANITALRRVMAARAVTDVDGVSTIGQILPNHLVYGAEWDDVAEIALNTQYTDYQAGKPNPIFKKLAPHMERLFARVFTSDWIAFDDTIDFIDVRFLEGFQGGPLTYSEMPDVNEHPEQGSFKNHSLGVKVGHTLGAKITNADGVGRVQGA